MILKTFLNMEMVSGGAATSKIQELEDLIIRHPIDHKRGPAGDKILKLLDTGINKSAKRKLKLGKQRNR